MQPTPRFCGQCGAERLSAAAAYCRVCGAALDRPTEESPADAAPQQKVEVWAERKVAYAPSDTPVPPDGVEWRRQRPLWLVVALTMLTGGFYPIVWLGATWSEMKKELDDPGMHPWGHALTQLVPIYGLFRLHDHFGTIESLLLRARAFSPVYPGGAVLGAIGSAVLQRVSNGASGVAEVLWFALAAGVMAAVVANGQAGLNTYWRAAPDRLVPVRIHWAEWMTLVIGGLITTAWVASTLKG